MTKWRAGAVALVVLVIGLGLAHRWSAAPLHRGKSIDYWLRQYALNVFSAAGPGAGADEAVQSILAIGTNGLPALLRQIEEKPSAMERIFSHLREHGPAWIRQHLPPQLHPGQSRSAALRALSLLIEDRTGSACAPVMEALLKLAEGPDSHLRIMAAETLSICALNDPSPAARDAFARMLNSPHTEVRQTSVRTLCRADVTLFEVASMLVPLLDDPSPIVRIHVARALVQRNIETDRALQVMINCLRLPDQQIQQAAAANLAALKEKAARAEGPLVDMLLAAEGAVLQSMLSSLRSINPAAAERFEPSVVELMQDLQSKDRARARSAAIAMIARKQEAIEASPLLLQWMRSEDNDRVFFANALWTANPSASENIVREMIRYLQDERAAHRPAAARLLAAMGERSTAALPALTPHLTSPNTMLRDASAFAILRISSGNHPSASPALSILTDALRTRGVSHRRQSAAEILSQLGLQARAALPALREARMDGNPEVRQLARAAIEQIEEETTAASKQ